MGGKSRGFEFIYGLL